MTKPFLGTFAACAMLLSGINGLAHAQSITQGTFGVVSGGPGTAPGQPPSAQAPSGAISGSVVDERGAPVARVNVLAIGPPMPTMDGRTVEMTRSMSTDEGGRFRIDRLPPQSYVVAVAPNVFVRVPRPSLPAATVANDPPVYAVTYYPGVIDRAQAQPISVAVGAEQTIFIELQRAQIVHVRGTVSSPSGRSTSGVPLQLQRTIGSSSSGSGVGYVQADGSFDVAIPAGSYTLAANVSPGTPTEFAAVDIKATNGDVDGVALLLGTGGSVRGQIVFDGPLPGSAPLGATLFLAATPGGPLMGRPSSVPVADDWTFEAKGLYGMYRFTGPATIGLPYKTARVEFDGRDVGTNAVEIRDGEHQVVIHLAPMPPRQAR